MVLLGTFEIERATIYYWIPRKYGMAQFMVAVLKMNVLEWVRRKNRPCSGVIFWIHKHPVGALQLSS